MNGAKDMFLARLRGYWYLFDQDSVETVAAASAQSAPVAKAGRLWVGAPDDIKVELCPLHLIFQWPVAEAEHNDYFLFLRHHERRFALPMCGEGRFCSINPQEMRQLPPAFSGLSRRIIPSLLLNGTEALMQIDLNELMQTMDKIAYLRRKKLKSRQDRVNE